MICPGLFLPDQPAQQVSQRPADAVSTGFQAASDRIQQFKGSIGILPLQQFKGDFFLVACGSTVSLHHLFLGRCHLHG